MPRPRQQAVARHLERAPLQAPFANLKPVRRLWPLGFRTVSSNPVEVYLGLMDIQLSDLLPALESSRERLWRRPSPSAWSPAEQLDHVISVHRFFSSSLSALWPFSSPIGQF